MRARALLALVFLSITPLLAAAQSPSVEADVVLVDGKVVTVDEAFRVAEAVAIRDGVFVRVGTSD